MICPTIMLLSCYSEHQQNALIEQDLRRKAARPALSLAPELPASKKMNVVVASTNGIIAEPCTYGRNYGFNGFFPRRGRGTSCVEIGGYLLLTAFYQSPVRPFWPGRSWITIDDPPAKRPVRLVCGLDTAVLPLFSAPPPLANFRADNRIANSPSTPPRSSSIAAINCIYVG